MSTIISRLTTRDVRFQLSGGAGADAVHSAPQYSFAVTEIEAGGLHGTGLVLTLGEGNDLVCSAITKLGLTLQGRDLDEVMAAFGVWFNDVSNHHQLRWLGPHAGVVHLALASITNALFDLWARSREVPLWRLLLDLRPEEVVALLDLSYLEDVLTAGEALALLKERLPSRGERAAILRHGYPGYDTSVGWFHYGDDQVRENARRALAAGFGAVKLKVGSPDTARDVRRAYLVRDVVGPDVRVMLDVNQQWTLPVALRMSLDLAGMAPFWIEEPTHPYDVLAHQTLARAIAPIPLAVGEHLPNRIVFKNFMQAGAVRFVQADCTRVGGVSEFITVSLLARKLGLPVVPHVGDMGQIHQHLVLFNHIALGHEVVFLEYIPHLRAYFREPAVVENGVYLTPERPGSSTDLL